MTKIIPFIIITIIFLIAGYMDYKDAELAEKYHAQSSFKVRPQNQ
jgi:hypothetical protein